MSELDHKEGWALKNWCFWTVVLEKTLESPLDCKEIKPVNPEGNQPWIFIRGTDAEAEVLIFGYLMRRADSGKRVSGKRLWCWGRPWAGEVGDRGWEGWMASLTQWTWVWTSSGRWWRTGKPGVPQSIGITKSWTQLSDWTAEWPQQGPGLIRSPHPVRLGSLHLVHRNQWGSDKEFTDHANWYPDLTGSFQYTKISVQQRSLMFLNFSQLWKNCGS